MPQSKMKIGFPMLPESRFLSFLKKVFLFL